MIVNVNGAPRELSRDATVAQLVRDLGRDPQGRGVAVAVNGEVVPRTRWTEWVLPEAATIEVLHAVGGG